MKINEVAEKLKAVAFNMPDPQKEVTGGYCGDFLSFVMGRAPSGCLWFTIMNNMNVAAVASLTETGAVVLCEGVRPDDALAAKVKAQDITLLTTDLTVYEAVRAVDL